MMDGLKNWRFFVNSGMDGQLSALLCTGMSPPSSVFTLFVECVGGGLIRFVCLFYLLKFNKIVTDVHRQTRASAAGKKSN